MVGQSDGCSIHPVSLSISQVPVQPVGLDPSKTDLIHTLTHGKQSGCIQRWAAECKYYMEMERQFSIVQNFFFFSPNTFSDHSKVLSSAAPPTGQQVYTPSASFSANTRTESFRYHTHTQVVCERQHKQIMSAWISVECSCCVFQASAFGNPDVVTHVTSERPLWSTCEQQQPCSESECKPCAPCSLGTTTCSLQCTGH